jgi:hypothetical protein
VEKRKMTQKAMKIDNLVFAVQEIYKRFSSFSLSLDFFYLYEQKNIQYVLASLHEVPRFTLAYNNTSSDLRLYSVWDDINKNEKRKREEPNVDVFGDTLNAVCDWQKIEDINVVKYGPVKNINKTYTASLKERTTIITFDLRDCNLIEIYCWGFYIKTNNIFSLIAVVHDVEEENDGNFHKYDYLSNKLTVAMHEKIGFVWPKSTRDISLLEAYWQKDDMSDFDELLYKTEADVGEKDYFNLDI